MYLLKRSLLNLVVKLTIKGLVKHKPATVTTCALEGSDCKAVRRGGAINGGGTKVAQGPDGSLPPYRVFYKELEEGACKIVDGNI